MASNAAKDKLEDIFREWKDNTKPGRGMTLVTAGQSGAGKSTLVKNLLRDPAPRSAHSPNSITKDVKSHSSLIYDVNVTIIDTPGLAGASKEDEAKILAQLHKESKGKADMLLYCISIAPSSKVGEIDRRIVNLLTMAFSSKIWERAIVVLTSADYVKDRNKKPGNPTVQAAMKEYATAFQPILTSIADGVTVTPVLKKNSATKRCDKEIAAVAAGETPDEEILPGMKWNECVFKEVLKKCSLESVPEIFKLLETSSSAWKGALGGAAAGAVAGASIGAVAGGVGAIPGAIGGAIGGVVGGGAIGGVVGGGVVGGVVHYSFKNSDQGKLAKEYEDIKKQRTNDPKHVNGETTGTQDENKKNK
jgi:GTP-binding protein EngB required for normal cell division